jgi:hypothetical protein
MLSVNTKCAFMNFRPKQSNQSHLLRPHKQELTHSNKILKMVGDNYKQSAIDSDGSVKQIDNASYYRKIPNLIQTTGFLSSRYGITKTFFIQTRGIAKIVSKAIDFDIANCVEGALFNVNGVAMNLEFQFAQYQVKVNGWGDEEDPIVISGVDNPSAMAAIEHHLINFDMKMKNLEWQLKLSEHLTTKDGRHIAKLTIDIKNTNEVKEYWFDITGAFKC